MPCLSCKLLSRKLQDATGWKDSFIARSSPATNLGTENTGGTGWGAWLVTGLFKIDAALLACFRVAGRSLLDAFANYGTAFHGIHPALHPYRDDGQLSLTQEERYSREIAAMTSYEEIMFEEEAMQETLALGRSVEPLRRAAQVRRRA